MPVAASFALIDQEQPDNSSSSSSSGSSSSSDASSDASSSSDGSSSSSVPSLQQVARLDTMVTVVDGERFVQDVLGSELLQERGLQAEEGDERTVAELLIEQVMYIVGLMWHTSCRTQVLVFTEFSQQGEGKSGGGVKLGVGLMC
jgi:hypothetical protein